MLVSISGCSDRTTLFLVSITCTYSDSASFHRLWSQYVAARLTIGMLFPLQSV